LLGRVPASERGLDPRGADASERWLAFERAATAIVGFDRVTIVPGAEFEEFVTALVTNHPAVVACDTRMIARDALAYRLAMVGYSTRDVGVILMGEASPAEVDADYARGLAALPRNRPTDTASAVVAALMPKPVLPGLTVPGEQNVRAAVAVDVGSALTRSAPARVWSILPASPGRRQSGPASAAQVPSDELDAQIRRYADVYNIDYRLVGAIIRQESNGLQASRSGKGAIGLMQLMPATAAMLNVNPRDPVDNIRGGIAYLAGLLRTYGDLRHALIAYNAGPTHANQVIRGERGLFAETRRYLAAIATMYPLN